MQAGIVSSGTEISSCPLLIETNHFHMYTEILFFFLKSVNGIRIKTSKRCKRQEKEIDLYIFFEILSISY